MANKIKELTEQFYESIRILPEYVKYFNSIGKDINWFNKQIHEDLLNVRFTNAVEIGKMYWFYYELDNWERFLYWDSMPLVIVTDVTETTFTGINIHYLPNKYRIQLFLTIMNQRTNSKILNRNTKMLINPEELQIFPNYSMLVHQYKRKNIKAGPYEVSGESWGAAVAMPLADFKISNRRAPKSNFNWLEVVIQPDINIIMNTAKKKHR
jgi:hypothetical protein